jgi:hypothetical protein
LVSVDTENVMVAAKLGQLLVWEWQSETYVLKQQGHFHDMNSIAYAPDASIIGTDPPPPLFFL